MGFAGLGDGIVVAHAVPLQNLADWTPINASKRLQTVDARQNPLALDVREPALGQEIPWIVVPFDDSEAGDLDVLQSESQLLAQSAQSFTGYHANAPLFQK